MFKKIFFAIVATACIGTATIGTAEARDGHRHRHNRSNVIIEFGGFGGGGYYGNRFDRGFGYGSGYYGDGYGYRRHNRYNRLYADDYFEPSCGTRRIKVKQWNRAHTHYTIVRKRVRSCY
jgi:hypothetical protein